MQNKDVGMTKEAYIQMCEALGDPVLEENLPPDFSDFPGEVQNAIAIYSYLRDNWDYMGGNYIGKDITILFQLFDLLKIEESADRKLIFDIIKYLDSVRQKIISNKKPSSPKKT